jgi:hypothetical protein
LNIGRSITCTDVGTTGGLIASARATNAAMNSASAAPHDGQAASETPVLSAKVLAALQLVQPDVQRLFQAMAAAVGRHDAASTAAAAAAAAEAGVQTQQPDALADLTAAIRAVT